MNFEKSQGQTIWVSKKKEFDNNMKEKDNMFQWT